MSSFSNSLYDCALECALRRRKNRCKVRFGGYACNDCKYNINRYVDADPRHVELFMIEAEMQAGAIKATSGGHHFVFVVLIALCLFFAGMMYKSEQRINTNLQQHTAKAQPVVQSAQMKKQPQPAPAAQTAPAQSVVTEEIIWGTLRKAAKDLNNKADVNRDGETNCIDAAVLFYQYFPHKSLVTITENKNDKTGMWHLFNVVYINGVWKAIEPQAIWRKQRGYNMSDIWGKQYDSSLNRDQTKYYSKYVK